MDALIDNIAQIVALIIAAVVTPALTRALAAARARFDESALLNRVDRERLMRNALNEAIQTAVRDGLARNRTHDEIVDDGWDYVMNSVPDAVRELGATSTIIQQKISAALSSAR